MKTRTKIQTELMRRGDAGVGRWAEKLRRGVLGYEKGEQTGSRLVGDNTGSGAGLTRLIQGRCLDVQMFRWAK